MSEKAKTKFDSVIQWVKNHKFFSYVLLFCIFLISLNELTGASDELLSRFGVVKVLDITSDNAKSALSKDIIRTAWNRLFWTRNYSQKVRRSAPEVELRESWNKYLDATEKWNTELMIYLLSLEKYYPNSDKRHILESRVQPLFRKIAIKMADLKYCPANQRKACLALVNEIQNLNNKLNSELYFFIYEIEQQLQSPE